MKNLKAVKALYVAFGGNASTVAAMTVTADVINALAALVAAQGGQLPAVTADNSGQVLTVNASGKWAAAALPAATPAG